MGGKQSFPLVKMTKDTVVIVTGANTGLGFTTAKWLAMLGATVIIACRNEDKAMKAIRRIDEEYKEARKAKLEGIVDYEVLALEYMHLDLASFQSTVEFAEAFKKTGRPLHILICNAGVVKQCLERTDDGFEAMLQVNYLSGFLLIGKLLALIKSTSQTCDDVRVILVSSDAYKFARFDASNMNYDGEPSHTKLAPLDYYGRSKLCQILQMRCLDRRLKNTNVSITALHPGMVDTEIRREFGNDFIWTTMVKVTRLFGMMKNTEDGAITIINTAVNKDLKGNGGIYYKDCRDAGLSATARNEDIQETVWKQTLTYLGDHLTQDEIYCLEGEDPN